MSATYKRRSAEKTGSALSMTGSVAHLEREEREVSKGAEAHTSMEMAVASEELGEEESPHITQLKKSKTSTSSSSRIKSRTPTPASRRRQPRWPAESNRRERRSQPQADRSRRRRTVHQPPRIIRSRPFTFPGTPARWRYPVPAIDVDGERRWRRGQGWREDEIEEEEDPSAHEEAQFALPRPILSPSPAKKTRRLSSTARRALGLSAQVLHTVLLLRLPRLYVARFEVEEELAPTFRATWDDLVNEWRTQSVVSALLLSAILSMLQQTAAFDPLVRILVQISLLCTAMSLFFGSLHSVSFKGAKAETWTQEKRTSTGTVLAVPAIWLGWSIILFVTCVIVFAFRSTSEAHDPLSKGAARGLRIGMGILLALGLSCFVFVILTLRRIHTGNKPHRRLRVAPTRRKPLSIAAQRASTAKSSLFLEQACPGQGTHALDRAAASFAFPVEEIAPTRVLMLGSPSDSEMGPPERTIPGDRMWAARDVHDTDWISFTEDVIRVWSNEQHNHEAAVSGLLHHWNQRFFVPRSLESVLCHEQQLATDTHAIAIYVVHRNPDAVLGPLPRLNEWTHAGLTVHRFLDDGGNAVRCETVRITPMNGWQQRMARGDVPSSIYMPAQAQQNPPTLGSLLFEHRDSWTPVGTAD
ncbi:unnamed protein product [Mycena citricolor]|uniref:Uncharacterized protein n=1 Tax=Mycena citricolor TaxID=2018698 RepID=A0AAD2JVB2_9AGAR|nr:unnamed protein product [Mycena citricolor]